MVAFLNGQALDPVLLHVERGFIKEKDHALTHRRQTEEPTAKEHIRKPLSVMLVGAQVRPLRYIILYYITLHYITFKLHNNTLQYIILLSFILL